MVDDRNFVGQNAGSGFDAFTFGLMTHFQSFQTGNNALDLMIIAILPTLIALASGVSRQVRPIIARIFKFFINLVFGSPYDEFSRIVRVERRLRRWGSTATDSDSRNIILHKAINIYLAETGSLDNQDNAKYRLMSLGKEKSTGSRYSPNYGSSSTHLKQYKVLTSVPEEVWVEYLPFKIKIMRCVQSGGSNDNDCDQDVEQAHNNNNNNNDENAESIEYHLKASGSDGNERIDQFLNAAFSFYKNKVRAEEDHGRHLYVRSVISSSDCGNNNNNDDNDDDGSDSRTSLQFKRYRLTDRSFDHLWFPQKEKMMSVLDDFLFHRNKFGIKGFRRKLGILLYGEPGTGKTSIIKAIATRSKRHIVSVDLSKIRTNQELMDLMFDLRFKVDGIDCPVQLNFSKVIFVLEDVDAAGDVVLSRAKKKKIKRNQRDRSGSGYETPTNDIIPSR